MVAVVSVVPTLARFPPSKALTNVLFPTLTCPTTATTQRSRTCPASRSISTASSFGNPAARIRCEASSRAAIKLSCISITKGSYKAQHTLVLPALFLMRPFPEEHATVDRVLGKVVEQFLMSTLLQRNALFADEATDVVGIKVLRRKVRSSVLVLVPCVTQK